MARKPVHSDNAPKAIGPYSQAVQVDSGKMLFLSGQIPLDPRSMELVQGDISAQTQRVMENLKAVLAAAGMELVQGDISAQTQRVMENLKAVLAAAGLDFTHVVRCTIFCTDLADFAKINEVYGKFFPADPPSRATVQVAALPKGAKVEIDAIAVS
jgi:2-iminobutanoate/2-iminopropanoate deaminase